MISSQPPAPMITGITGAAASRWQVGSQIRVGKGGPDRIWLTAIDMIWRRRAHRGRCGPDQHRRGDLGTRRSAGSVHSALEEGGADRISDEDEVQGRDARRDPASACSGRAVQTRSQWRMKLRDAVPDCMQAMRRRLPFSSSCRARRSSMQVMRRFCTPPG
jgi:hypothetical protein